MEPLRLKYVDESTVIINNNNYILKYRIHDNYWKEKIIPIKLNKSIDQIKNEIDEFLSSKKTYEIKSIKLFGRNFTNYELENYQILSFDDWYNEDGF